MKYRLLVIVTTLLCANIRIELSAQETRVEISQLGIFSSENYGTGKVYFNQNQALIDITLAKTLVAKELDSWGIQIYMGSGKNARSVATSVLNGFEARYPDVDARLLYPSPYFKVQVGNYKTRIEAESFRQKILSEYPNARIESIVVKKEDR